MARKVLRLTARSKFTFRRPRDEATLFKNITVDPAVSITNVYTYYSDYDHLYSFGFTAGPSASFKVTVGKDVADRWGQTLGKDQVIRFGTGPLRSRTMV